MRQHLAGFMDFMRERGVAGFAIGFILGGAAQKLVQAFMDDIVNPMLGLFGGSVQNLADYTVGTFKIGDFISVLINFLILCLVVYLVFKVLHLEKLDKPKE
ncbi:hypothetical protein A2851_00135 [Candidatus Kaiserbacteria bacterium RIFCSPHIGHO2_01_FULL_53_29]|uniref:Mechanosensitive ion channel protein MscL n=1 Tax=Candidatus Kaiserbacteria bacterium RIFCSPHIGHO2_01_FULL_53_29 TaxID=1798480 RepID=A0A1F6CW35_9BACT|nr:MAG: hypothetical protein A2851_00135 [Candidatus Kaiserbacteria bacterium RIFCSPHIGHO2_01_FULL_53_29]